jgi:hypothetical protein
MGKRPAADSELVAVVAIWAPEVESFYLKGPRYFGSSTRFSGTGARPSMNSKPPAQL